MDETLRKIAELLDNDSIYCPGNIGLSESCREDMNCVDCWVQAIKQGIAEEEKTK